jgi:hypothetical protein
MRISTHNRINSLRVISLVAALTLAGNASAQEPVGCDKFKWPTAREQALLKTAASANVKSGDTIGIPSSAHVELQRLTEISLPNPSSRPPRDKSNFGGFLRLDVAKAGLYSVALTNNAWIDAIQNGAPLKTMDFSGVGGCEAIRKVVRFQFDAGPLLLQISDNAAPTINIAVTSAE